MSRSINFPAMLVLLVMASSALVIIEAELTCPQIIKAVIPCLGFVKGNSPKEDPSPACCSGAKDLESKAPTKPDQLAVCECFILVLPKIGPYDPNRLPQIGEKCGVKVTIPPITGDTDCSKYQLISSFSFHL